MIKIVYYEILRVYFQYLILRKIKKNGKIVLVDFDFTLAIHECPASYKTWDLTVSTLNKSLLKELKCRKSEFYIFTARGLRSKKLVINWLDRMNISCGGLFFLGNTSNKIKVVQRIAKFGKVIWYDDLADINPKTCLKKIYHPEIPTSVEFIRL